MNSTVPRLVALSEYTVLLCALALGAKSAHATDWSEAGADHVWQNCTDCNVACNQTLQRGQKVRVSATLDPDPGGAPTTAWLETPAGRLDLTGARQYMEWGDCDSVADARANLHIQGWDLGDLVHVYWELEALSNLAACAPQFNPDGSISYGYEIQTPSHVNWCGRRVSVGVWLASRNDTGQWIIESFEEPWHTSGLQDVAGQYCSAIRAARPYLDAPADATHLLVMVNNQANEIDEIPETDRGDNLASVPIPMCRLDSLRLTASGTAEIGYSIYNAVPEQSPVISQVPIELYYAAGATEADIAGRSPVFRTVATVTADELADGGASPASIRTPRLPEPGENDTHLIAVINNSRIIPRVGPGPFLQSSELVELAVSDLAWDGKGGVRFRFDARGAIASHARLRYRLEWIVNDGERERRVPVFPRKRTIDLEIGQSGKRISSSRMKLPTRPADLYNVTHLAVTVEDDAGLLGRASSRRARIELPHPSNGQLSYELASAPAAATAERRVFLWMRNYERAILGAASRYRIDARGITAAIAWEALKNQRPFTNLWTGCTYCSFSDCEWRPALGPGKVHWTNESAPLVGETTAWEVEQRGYVTPSSGPCERWSRVLQPETAIEYIAAIMHGFSSLWDPYFDIRGIPILLCKYYQGDVASDRQSLTDLDRVLQEVAIVCPPAAQPFGPNSMGRWVQENPLYVNLLLRSTRAAPYLPAPPCAPSVAVVFFTGYFPCRDVIGDSAATNQSFITFAAELQREFRGRVAAIAIPQTCCGTEARQQANSWLHEVSCNACVPPKVVLVGHSLGGDTVESATDIPNRFYSITIDPINRNAAFPFQRCCGLSTPCGDSPPYPGFFLTCDEEPRDAWRLVSVNLNQRNVTVAPLAPIDENYLAAFGTCFSSPFSVDLPFVCGTRLPIVAGDNCGYFLGHHVLGAREVEIYTNHGDAGSNGPETVSWRTAVRAAIERALVP